MAVAIRLRQEGNKGRPYFRIVAADSRYKRDGRFIEVLGTYNPGAKGQTTQIDLVKVDKWIGQGAKPTESVKSMINKARLAK
jgi:small subunit ribosomal protein S16